MTDRRAFIGTMAAGLFAASAAAKLLGLAIPQSLLLRADEVIQ